MGLGAASASRYSQSMLPYRTAPAAGHRSHPRIWVGLGLVASMLLLAACQAVPPAASDDGATTVGNMTVRTGGYVRVDSGIVGN
jgi:hypothetical protein